MLALLQQHLTVDDRVDHPVRMLDHALKSAGIVGRLLRLQCLNRPRSVCQVETMDRSKRERYEDIWRAD